MKKLLLLLMFAASSVGMHAEGEYPNALIIQQTGGAEKVFLLEESTLKILPSMGNVTVISNGAESIFPLSEVTGIKYEYRNPSTLGIGNIMLADDSTNAVYSIDGRKLSTNVQSLSEALQQLPHGVYVVKTNGRTLKITK